VASSMTWEFEVRGEPFDGRPGVLAARGSYVTVHIGTGAIPGEEAPRSAPWPAEWVAALGAEFRT
jgi:acyl-CoA thioester hydrolase